MFQKFVGTKYISRTKQVPTQVAFLPLYNNGERACIVVPGTSNVLNSSDIIGEVGLGCLRLDMIREVLWFNLGYPMELINLQNQNLYNLLQTLRKESVNVAIALDLNGASSSLLQDPWSLIKEALEHVALVHMNWDEAIALNCNSNSDGNTNVDASTATIEQLDELAQPFLDRGVAIVTITLGCHGAYIGVHSERTHIQNQLGVACLNDNDVENWCQTKSILSPLPIRTNDSGGSGDTVGAGDSFVAGMLLCLESMALNKDTDNQKRNTLNDVLNFAQKCAGDMINGSSDDGCSMETKE